MVDDAGQNASKPQEGFVFDADVEQAAETYARAVLEAAKKSGRIDAVVEELNSLVTDVFGPAPKVEAVFNSPRIGIEEKLALIDKIFSGKASPETVAVLKILVRNRRMPIIRPIVRAMHGLMDEVAGTIEVTVTSAVPLTVEQTDDLQKTLGTSLGKWIRLVPKVDDRLLGGLVIRVGDTVYDSSLATQLTQLRRTVLDQTRRKMNEQFDRFATTT